MSRYDFCAFLSPHVLLYANGLIGIPTLPPIMITRLMTYTQAVA